MGKKITILLAALIFAWYFFSGSDQKTTAPPAPANIKSKTAPPVQKKQVAPVPQKQTATALSTVASWPFTGREKDAPLLDSKLTRKNYLLIFDGSGSMNEKKCSGMLTKAEAAKDAVKEWSVSVDADANLGLIVFDEQGLSLRVPLGINNREQFRKQIEAVTPNYKTPLTRSFDHAYQLLTEQAFKQLGYGEYTIVVVTDGIANEPQALANSVNRILSRSPVMINTIGFCVATNHSLNQPGKTFYTAANDPAALRQGLQAVLAESESFDLSAFQ